jgi:hypothetical protein
MEIAVTLTLVLAGILIVASVALPWFHEEAVVPGFFGSRATIQVTDYRVGDLGDLSALSRAFGGEAVTFVRVAYVIAVGVIALVLAVAHLLAPVWNKWFAAAAALAALATLAMGIEPVVRILPESEDVTPSMGLFVLLAGAVILLGGGIAGLLVKRTART